MSGERFDPGPRLRVTRRNGRTITRLDVHWRVVWLRQEHPDARLATEHVRITDDEAIFRAIISIEGRGSASGHGVARRQEHADYIERAETRAIGRALLALGFGTEHADDFVLDEEEPAPPAAPQLPAGVTVGPGGGSVLPPRVAAALARAVPIRDEDEALAPAAEAARPASPAEPEARPAPTLEQPARARPSSVSAGREGPAPASQPAAREEGTPSARFGRGIRPAPRPAPDDEAGTGDPEPAATNSSTTRPTRERTVRENTPAPVSSINRRATPEITPDPAPDPAPETSDADDEAADHDWTAFWRWARRQGYNNRDEIQQAIGRPITGRTPKELRTLIMNLSE